MAKTQPCRWVFAAGLDPKAHPGISASYNAFYDRWWCNEHRCGMEFPRGTAPKEAPSAFGQTTDMCREEVAERTKRERKAKWAWWRWYFRTLPSRILDVFKGSDTGGDDY